MAHVIVEEKFSSQPSEDEMKDAAEKIDAELAKHGARWKRTYRSLPLEREICEFEAPDVDVVRGAYQAAGLDIDRIYVAEVSDEQQPAWH